MMSFKRANDATYIAQLLGRMVRTPMQMHIQVDYVLNDVHLFLPYFNEDTVKDVVEALQNSEGGEIPTDIYGESTGGKKFETLTVKTKKKKGTEDVPGQIAINNFSNEGVNIEESEKETVLQNTADTKPSNQYHPATTLESKGQEQQTSAQTQPKTGDDDPSAGVQSSSAEPAEILNKDTETELQSTDSPPQNDLFDREAVMKFINDAGLLSYNVRALRINDYLKSLYRMAHLLTMSGLHRGAIREIQSEIADMIHNYVQELKANGKYDELVLQVKQFKLATQIFDAFGESVDNYFVHDLFTTTDSDIDRQFRIADMKLGNEGIGMVYGNKYMDKTDLSSFKVDVILFVADDECINKLHKYAETRFHGLNDDYRKYVATVDSEKIRRQYDNIVSDGDVVSKHNFRLPETIQVPHEVGGQEYRNHLFVSEITGVAKLKLNGWESGVIEEEQGQNNFVCWIRNPTRASWALCIPYEIDGEIKPAFPDFIVVRKDDVLGYVVDILEPHNSEFKDNLGKAKGFAEYARQNPGIGRIQLIRKIKGVANKDRFKRLDMSKSAVREKVSHIMSNDELDHIFDTDGFFV